MRLNEAKELFRHLTETYFAAARVIFSSQSRSVKPDQPLVLLTAGTLRRPLAPINRVDNGEVYGQYPSRLTITVDLFSHGAPIYDGDTVFAYENTALDDIVAFADFLNSQYAVDWCYLHDASILIDGDPQDLTGVVNDTNYQYRARLTVLFYFTQDADGYTTVVPYTPSTGETPPSGGVTTPSGGGTEELAAMETGYFTEVEFKEETGNE